MVIDTPDQNRCPLCKVTFRYTDEFEEHKSTTGHRVKWLKHWYQTQRRVLASNKNGVEIEFGGQLVDSIFDPEHGAITVFVEPGGQLAFDMIVKNTSKTGAVILRQVEALHATKCIKLGDLHEVTKNTKYVRILPGVEYSVTCQVNSGELGIERVPFAFQFKSEDQSTVTNKKQPFFIVRTIEVATVDSVAKDAGASSPFIRMKTKFYSRHDRGTYIPGIPISSGGGYDVPRKLPLPQYKYRGMLKNIACKNFDEAKVADNELDEAERLKDMLEDGLNPDNYTEWYQTLLWLEEMQMEIDIQYYSMDNVPLINVPRNNYSRASCVELEVLGLSENRPSVLRGDSVFATFTGQKTPVYEGVVHQVNDSSLYLAFANKFMAKFFNNMKVDVDFTFNRYPQRVSHRAVEIIGKPVWSPVTFPSEIMMPLKPPCKIIPFNRDIERNAEQLEAVMNIVNGTSKPSPYIIFGPPGTGKTVTVVEAIKQVYRLDPSSRILAAAPSNSAVDQIAKRLLTHVSKADVFRMYAQSRNIKQVPEELREIANVVGNEVVGISDTKLKESRILLCTYVTAARIASAPIPVGHITHAFLDECGHAMEPECMASIAGIVNSKGQIVLAGDPHQLGPVIRNRQCYSSGKLFPKTGLDKSFLERLMERRMYQPEEEQYNKKVVTKLLMNYRSHKTILKVSNELFYNNELKACGDQMFLSSFCKWEHLPTRDFPLIFHGVKGTDEREGNSPSFFNAQEVSRVVDYTLKILDSKNPKVVQKEIGIITPYRRQVEKIRAALRNKQKRMKKNFEDIKVGTPEEFQGDERRVIIISTVRASADQLAEDQLFKLGFLRNPKRFNVSITRAKALLIAVGCPNILRLDRHWRSLLTYIEENGGYVGPPATDEGEDLDDILARFDKLNLRPTLAEEEPSIRELAEAPEWRNEC